MKKFPPLFISHGGPGELLDPNNSNETIKTTISYWERLGHDLVEQKVKGIVCVSAHWYNNNYESDSCISINTVNKIIHDFGEFYPGIYDNKYSFTPPTANIVDELAKSIEDVGVKTKQTHRGLDHGAWIPLKYMFPKGNLPIIQIQLPNTVHYNTFTQLGTCLGKFCDEHEYQFIASGGLVHNLREAFQSISQKLVDCPPRQAFKRFKISVIDLLKKKRNMNGEAFMELLKDQFKSDYYEAHPTPDHFLPLLVAIGAFQFTEIVVSNDLWFATLSMAAISFE